MTEVGANGRAFKLVGGRLCLDFVNTVGNWLDPARRREHLAGYGDLVAWARQAGALEDAEAAALLRAAAERPEEAGAVLERARALPRPPEVIVATGNGAAEAVLAALRGGAYDAVPKPYRMAEVELLVRRASEKRRLRDEVEALRAELARVRRERTGTGQDSQD